MRTAFLLLFNLACLRGAYSGGGRSRFTSIISFGDSYADTGNLVMWPEPFFPGPLPFENLPYGQTFFGHPTGRVTDGRLVLDFIAEALGLPFVPPYLAKGSNFSAGVNFAVAGAPALTLTYLQGQNLTVNPPINSSLHDQLEWFQKLKPSLCKGQGADCFGSSLFIMGEFGSNDYRNILMSNRTVEQALVYVPLIVDSISRGVESWLKLNRGNDNPLQRLIQQGAKYIVVADVFPTGCIPPILTMLASPNKVKYDRHGCLKSGNRLGRYQNSLLRQWIKLLRHEYPHTKIITAEYYRPVLAFLDMPGHFGLNSSTTLLACCGAGGPPYNYDFNAGRKAIHEQEFHSPLSTFSFIQKYPADLALIPRGASGTATSTAVQQPTGARRKTWTPPLEGHFKLMVDAAISRNNDRRCIAVICRDELGHYQGSSEVVLQDMVKAETLEAMAFREAFALALDIVG
ncbi:GDSL esterase/lipase At5g45910 isoform X1 [Triticum aestivum]|uniref:GDSL esterase/lipase At5g45910 isoform X1 n=1 Tax=Triticum aestivum TaxID=4565 RepID=UPI001D00D66D|nr:GDSL esterase/lipase At5g45910-like isoform X1 [Triticum aestivum]